MSPPTSSSERFARRAERELRRELLIEPWPELGLVALDGPGDPEPELVLRDGRVVAIDGRSEDEFDAIDHFLARHAFDLDAVAAAAALDDGELARALVDVDVPRERLVRLSRGSSPGWIRWS